MNNKYNSDSQIHQDSKNNSLVSNLLNTKPQKSLLNKLIESHVKRTISQFPINLRGGGCGQAKQVSKVEEKQIIGVPKDLLIKLENNVNIINTKASLLIDPQQRNEVIIAFQWFMYNREHLNTCCVNQNLTQSIYTKSLNSFRDLLKILPIYLRSSWFLCYQVLQICNDLLRIIYSFQLQNEDREMELTMQQEFLQDVEEFKVQLGIEQANVWSTGLEYEITLIKIMLMNCQTNSEEGKNLLINIVKNVVQSALAMSPNDDLIPSLIEGAKFLFLQYKDKVLYPQEVYATYYLFQTLKWSIVRQLKSQYSVYNQLKQLKDVFQQYILNSDNWIIHYSWISMIIDILAYRPTFDKFEIVKGSPIEQQSMWNNLIENNLILSLPYNRSQGSVVLFQNQVKYFSKEITNVMEQQSIPKFKLISESLIKGQFSQQINLWNFYKDFKFKKKQETTLKDYEIVLQNNDLVFLEKQIERFNSQLDELVLLYSQIQESFTDYFTQQDKTSLQIKLLQDDYTVFEKQFLDGYKQAIHYLLFIIERSTIEFEKLKLLFPYFDILKIEVQQNLKKYFQSIEEFIKVKFQAFQEDFLLNFLNVVEYLSYLSEISLNPISKNQSHLEKVNSKFQVQNHLSSNQNSEKSLILQKCLITIKEFEQKFSFSISSIKTNDINIKIIPCQIQAMSNTICSGQWIKIMMQQLSTSFSNRFDLSLNEVKIKEDIEQIYRNCIFSLQMLKQMKQFCKIHQYKIKTFDQNLEEEKNLAIQEQQNFYQDFKIMLIKQLTQQKEQLDFILKSKENDKSSHINKEKKKQLLQQIMTDYQMIQNGYENIVSQDIKAIKSQVLIFLQEAQFITLQNQNEHFDFNALNRQMEKYDKFIREIQNKQGKYNTSLIEEEQKLTFQHWIRRNKHLDFCHFCVDQDLNEIKNTNKLLKLLKQLLILIINQLQQTDNKEIQVRLNNFNIQMQQLETTLNIKTQIASLIKIFKGSNQQEMCKCIIVIEQENYQQNWQLNRGNDQQIEQVESTLQETLAFFQLNQQSQDKIPGNLDPLYLNIINNLCEQITIKKSIFDVFDFSNDYKIRECLAYNLIKLQQGIKEEIIEEFSSKLIQYLWIFEKDQRVRNLLKNKELVEIQKLFFSKDIKSTTEQIKQEMKFRIKSIENIQQELKLEGNSQIKEQHKQQLQLAYEELEQYQDGVAEMSEKMDISLLFLKDISKDVKQIKSSIDNLQESLNQVGDDIRKLKGKKYDELLEIRKQKILLQSRLAEVDSVYVQVKTIEYDPVRGESIKSKEGITITNLMCEQWNDFTGEVNEFIWDESKQHDVMLLSGNAGSGKSKAARKIEEFLWKQKEINSKWIPIFVSLPTLKNPKYNLFEQALESDNYQFDKYQLREFKDAIQNKKEFIILILDSYDEMKQDCIQQNLIITNKLINDLNINNQVKIIFTTRREILNVLGYQTWFYGDSIRNLKEVQIQDFDKVQKNDYLTQYAELSVKRKIRNVYDFLKQISQQNLNLDEFLSIWHCVNILVQNSIQNSHKGESEYIFESSSREELIKKILEQSPFNFLKEEQITGLRKDLSSLWSVYKFEKAIENIGIGELLSTPFMFEIIVQVLPNMAKQQQGSVDLKNRFVESYLSIIQKSSLSKYLQENYKNNLDQKENNQVNKPIFDVKRQKIQNFEQLNNKELKAKTSQLLEEMESLKFFQSYSITSVLKIECNSLLVDNQSFSIQSQDRKNVIQGLKMKKYTIFEFYESFIHFYHDQQIQKLRETGKISNWESFQIDLLQFSSNLAIDMTKNELSQITYQQKGKLKLRNNYTKQVNDDDWLDGYFNDLQQELDYNKLIRSCILLNTKGSSYSFTHKSIQEFYVAKFIIDLLLQSGSQFQNKNNSDQKQTDRLIKSLYSNKVFNITKDHFKGVLTFINGKISSLDNIKSILINIVKQSKNEKYIYAASNSIFLLSQLDVYLGYEDFSQIQLRDTNISGLSFCNADLSKSKFTNVNINSCNFNYADLTEVEWTAVKCKEKPFLEGDEEVKVVQFSPNGELIASNGKGNLVSLWDVKNYQVIQQLDGHKDKILSVAFSPDGKILASSSQDKTIKLWDIQNPQIKLLISTLDYHYHPVIEVKFTFDGKKIVSVDSSGMLIICNFEGISEKPRDIIFEYQQDILVYTFTNDDQLIALGLDDSSIKLVEVKTRDERILIGHTGMIKALAFSKDGIRLVSACTNLLLLWDLRDNCKCQVLSFQEYQIQYITIPNEREIVIGAENFLAYGEFQYDYSAYFANIQYSYPVQLFPKSNFAVIVQHQTALIFDLNTQAIINSIYVDDEISQIEIASNEQKLIIRGKEVRFLDLNTFQEISISEKEPNTFYYQDLIFEQCQSEIIIYDDKNQYSDESDDCQYFFDQQIYHLSLQVNYQILAVQDWHSDKIILYDIKEKKLMDNQILHEQQVLTMLFSPYKPILSTIFRDGGLYFWNISKAPFECQKFNEIDEGVHIVQINYSPDGTLLIIQANDNKIRILDEINGSLIKILDQFQSSRENIVVSYDNNILAICQLCWHLKILLWNINKNEEIVLEVKDIHSDFLLMQFCPDGVSFACLSNSNLIFWNYNSGEILINYQLPPDSTYKSISFSKNGNLFVTGGSYIRIWKYFENKIEVIGAYNTKSEIQQLLFIDNDQNLMYTMNRQIKITPLSKCNLKGIIQTYKKFCQFFSNGYLVTNNDQGIEIFDWKQQKLIFTIDNRPQLVQFFQDGLHCIISNRQSNYRSSITKYNIDSKERIFYITISEDIESIKLSKNDQILILACKNILKLFNIEDPQKIYEIHSYANESLSQFFWNSNNDYICYRPNSDFVIREINTQNKIKFIFPESRILTVSSFNCNNEIFIQNSEGSGIFDLITQTFNMIDNWFRQSVISFDGQLIACRRLFSHYGYQFQFYDRQNKKDLNCAIYDYYQIPIKFSKIGDQLHCNKENGQIIIYSIDEKKQAKFLCSYMCGSEVDEGSVTPSFDYISVKQSKRLKLMNLNWISQAQLVCRKDKEQKDENKVSFVISSNDNSKIIIGQSSEINTLEFDLKECQQLQRKIDNWIIINCLVEIDQDTICVCCNKKIYLFYPNKYEKTLLGEHDKIVTSLSYSQESSLLASSSQDQKIFLWDVKAKKKIAVFEGHTANINQVSFSPDGYCLASASDDKQIKLWNIEKNEQSKISKGHQKSVNQVAYSPDGLIIASCSEDFSIILWDLLEKSFIIRLEEHTTNVQCLQFHNSSWRQLLGSGSYDGSICLWNVEFPQETTLLYKIKEPYLYPDFLCFFSEGFATISNTQGKSKYNESNKITRIQVWSFYQIDKNDQKLEKCKGYSSTYPICISNDNVTVFLGFGNLVRVYNAYSEKREQCELIENLEGHQAGVKIIKSWDKGRQLLSVDENDIMIIWQKTGNSWKKQSQILLEYPHQIDIINYDKQDYIVQKNSNAIIISNLNEMQKQLPFIDLDMKFQASYLSKSQKLFILMGKDEITLLDSLSGEIKCKLQNFKNSQSKQKKKQNKYQKKQKNNEIQPIVSNDDRFLAIYDRDKNIIKIVEISQNQEEVNLDFEGSLKIFEFSRNDPNILYTASDNCVIKKWNIKNKQNEIITELEYSTSECLLQFSPNCNFIVYSTNFKQLSVINLNNKQQYQTDIENLNGIIAFSQNEILVALATKDYKIYLWNYGKSIITEMLLFQKESAQNLLFINDDTELVCCEKETICIFSIEKDLILKLKNIWEVWYCDFYTFCPKYQSILCYRKHGNKRIAFLNPGQCKVLLDEQQQIRKFYSTYEGSYIVQLNYEGFIIWDFKNEKQILNTQKWSGTDIMLRYSTLIIGDEKKITVLDISELDNIKEIQTISFNESIRYLSFTSKQQYFVCAFYSQIIVMRLDSNRYCYQVAIYDRDISYDTNVVLQAKGDFLIYNGTDSYELIWIRQYYSLELNNKKVAGLVYSSNFKNFITLIDGHPQLLTKSLRKLESELEGSIKDLQADYIKSASIDSIFAISCNRCILIVKIIDKNKLTLMRKVQTEDNICSLDINPLGTLLIAGNQFGSIHLWDLTISNEMDNIKPNLIIKNQNNQIKDFTFSPNGTDFAAGIYDGSINLYSVEQIKNDQQKNENQEQSQIQVAENIKKEFKLICYKSFSRESLLLANQCTLKNSKITQNNKSIIQLFKQKGARE